MKLFILGNYSILLLSLSCSKVSQVKKRKEYTLTLLPLCAYMSSILLFDENLEFYFNLYLNKKVKTNIFFSNNLRSRRSDRQKREAHAHTTKKKALFLKDCRKNTCEHTQLISYIR